MARAREFSHKKAMEKATRLFWNKGYANTSLRDILKAMGIGESSFYNAFKSKRNAYLECLKHYDATVNAGREKAFMAEPTAGKGLRAFFQEILACLNDPKLPRVCLLAGSIAPNVLAEKELGSYMKEQASGWVTHMAARFEAEKAEGILQPDFESEAVANIIVTFIQGLWRMALISYDHDKLQRDVEILLTALKL